MAYRYYSSTIYATRIDLKDSKAVEGVFAFAEAKLLNLRSDYKKLIEDFKCVWIVSTLGSIRDNKLELETELYAGGGDQDCGNDEYDPIGQLAHWKSNWAVAGYGGQLRLAHDRNVRQVEYHLEQLSAGFRVLPPGEVEQ